MSTSCPTLRKLAAACLPAPLLLCGFLLIGCGQDDDPGFLLRYPTLRFVALGDTGEGNEAQYAVADVLQSVCAEQRCDFILLLGDNIYNTGVSALDDVQWQDKFELPYANIDVPFYAVLGNHDYGSLSLDESRADFQVAYTDVSDKWIMPARYYEHSHSNVDFFGLDTHATLFLESLAEVRNGQEAWLSERLGDVVPDERWRIAYGHHPYISNGLHGNAGAFDGFTETAPASGIALKQLFDEQLCGKIDLYLCGHDHDRQWHETQCDGTQFIVSGAGAKLRSFRFEQPVHWADDTTEGFAWFEIDGETLTVQFWDRYGVMNYEGGWTR